MEPEQKKAEEKQTNWLEIEATKLEQSKYDGERLDGLILEEGKITDFEIIVGEEPFQRWNDVENEVVKVIIPVEKDGKKFNFWLNSKNPTYFEIIKRLKEGQRSFKILRTGKMKQTRYQLVD